MDYPILRLVGQRWRSWQGKTSLGGNPRTEAREYYKKKGLISDADWSVYMKTLKSAY